MRSRILESQRSNDLVFWTDWFLRFGVQIRLLVWSKMHICHSQPRKPLSAKISQVARESITASAARRSSRLAGTNSYTTGMPCKGERTTSLYPNTLRSRRWQKNQSQLRQPGVHPGWQAPIRIPQECHAKWKEPLVCSQST